MVHQRTSPRQLAEATVEYWRIDLDCPALRELRVFAPEETARAGRFLRSRDRQRYLAGRAALRSLLTGYTGIDAADLLIRNSANGKPCLDAEFPLGRLAFNLSHSDGLALAGFAWNAQIGVDIERTRSFEDWRSIARDCFAAAELDELYRLPDGQQLDGFFAGWTRKEAFVKALSGGLSIPLQQFEVTLHPDHPADLLRVDHSLGCGTDWQLFAPIIDPGYRCAVAVSGSGWRFVDAGPYGVGTGIAAATQP